jgi:hypothetical protein
MGHGGTACRRPQSPVLPNEAPQANKMKNEGTRTISVLKESQPGSILGSSAKTGIFGIMLQPNNCGRE